MNGSMPAPSFMYPQPSILRCIDIKCIYIILYHNQPVRSSLIRSSATKRICLKSPDADFLHPQALREMIDPQGENLCQPASLLGRPPPYPGSAAPLKPFFLPHPKSDLQLQWLSFNEATRLATRRPRCQVHVRHCRSHKVQFIFPGA